MHKLSQMGIYSWASMGLIHHNFNYEENIEQSIQKTQYSQLSLVISRSKSTKKSHLVKKS